MKPDAIQIWPPLHKSLVKGIYGTMRHWNGVFFHAKPERDFQQSFCVPLINDTHDAKNFSVIVKLNR